MTTLISLRPLKFEGDVIEWPLPGAVWSFEEFDEYGRKYVHALSQQSVVVSISEEADAHIWAHVSTAFPSRLPTWQEFRRVKDQFLGEDSRAIQVLPPASEYVNIHPYCLHLFVCLDADVLPDFRRGEGL